MNSIWNIDLHAAQSWCQGICLEWFCYSGYFIVHIIGLVSPLAAGQKPTMNAAGNTYKLSKKDSILSQSIFSSAAAGDHQSQGFWIFSRSLFSSVFPSGTTLSSPSVIMIAGGSGFSSLLCFDWRAKGSLPPPVQKSGKTHKGPVESWSQPWVTVTVARQVG